MFDFIVIGAGIAGLAIAEYLQRSGQNVCLLEKDSHICNKSSAQLAGWFHTGTLYNNLSGAVFLQSFAKNLETLEKHYQNFEHMNIGGRSKGHSGWFKENFVYYIYVSAESSEVKLSERHEWLSLVKNLEKQSKNVQTDVVKENIFSSFDEKKYPLALISSDRTMDTRLIAIDLLNSYIGHGGVLHTDTQVTHISKKYVDTKKIRIHCKNVIVAAGQGTIDLAKVTLKTVYSPIAVAYPPLTHHNFVKMTPCLQSTFNHMYHLHKGVGYSVIGNGLFFSGEKPTVHLAKNKTILKNVIKEFYPDFNGKLKIFYGSKTEVLHGKDKRNYTQQILNTGSCLVAIPGKFSLSFSLAAQVGDYFGIQPKKKTLNKAGYKNVEQFVAFPRHSAYFAELA